MKGGTMQKVSVTDEEEKRVAEEIMKLDDLMLDFRHKIRGGERLTQAGMKERLRALGYLA